MVYDSVDKYVGDWRQQTSIWRAKEQWHWQVCVCCKDLLMCDCMIVLWLNVGRVASTALNFGRKSSLLYPSCNAVSTVRVLSGTLKLVFVETRNIEHITSYYCWKESESRSVALGVYDRIWTAHRYLLTIPTKVPSHMPANTVPAENQTACRVSRKSIIHEGLRIGFCTTYIICTQTTQCSCPSVWAWVIERENSLWTTNYTNIHQ